MRIELNGYSPDRKLNVLSNLLSENGYEAIDGVFTWTAFDSVDDLTQNIQDLISNFFAPMPLAKARFLAIAEINELAGEARKFFGTDIPFQGDLYQLKEKEAIAYQGDGNPTAEKYPIMYAEAGAREIAISVVATEYITNATLFPLVLSVVETYRMGLITSVQSALDSEAVQNIILTENSYTLPTGQTLVIGNGKVALNG